MIYFFHLLSSSFIFFPKRFNNKQIEPCRKMADSGATSSALPVGDQEQGESEDETDDEIEDSVVLSLCYVIMV